ncbi:uncharacterized protein GGS25DRAFT_172874 [Hypoxylon fragiforme]|uniref:uncharacterized protein n=1 Tax=Hypoxylon fragiforme TaxID=63214 RepID=UPI0020C67AE9|nr:uncharacterized protein GGS25DRAFT_172874 [Hypoxylon fragiforme]KAI2610923.1 hypothetical protein GGS25DRAFT_172874 [Hypoxylon fragiforme]
MISVIPRPVYTRLAAGWVTTTYGCSYALHTGILWACGYNFVRPLPRDLAWDSVLIESFFFFFFNLAS